MWPDALILIVELANICVENNNFRVTEAVVGADNARAVMLGHCAV